MSETEKGNLAGLLNLAAYLNLGQRLIRAERYDSALDLLRLGEQVEDGATDQQEFELKEFIRIQNELIPK